MDKHSRFARIARDYAIALVALAAAVYVTLGIILTF